MCETCDWADLLEEIDELLDDPRADFAVDTLEGIKEWVEENEHVTERQKAAVANIARAVDEKDE